MEKPVRLSNPAQADMETLSHSPDDDLDFGVTPEPQREVTIIGRELHSDERIDERWKFERAKASTGPQKAVWHSPADVAPDILRVRGGQRFPWPVDWPEMERRVWMYPGDLCGVIGGPGSGKTQYAIQVARGLIAAGRGCVNWLGLELSEADICMRIAANLTRRHAAEVRDQWPLSQIQAALATVTDRWRFVDRASTLEGQIEGLERQIGASRRIYNAPAMWVVDYAQLLGLMNRRGDARADMSGALEALRLLAERTESYGFVLSQTSGANTSALAGNVHFESATDGIRVGAESTQMERACAHQITLVVFKADDAESLDAHQLISKTRWSGREGKIGARYHKPGGVWEELDHLPATPVEIRAEVKKRKRRKKEDGEAEATPSATREELNAARAEEAASARRAAVIDALRSARDSGLLVRDLRKVPRTGSARRLQTTLDELRGVGRVLQTEDGRWRFVQ